MERDEIRLECIKLAVSRTPNNHIDAIARAEDYFDFVMKLDRDDESRLKGGIQTFKKSTENAGKP